MSCIVLKSTPSDDGLVHEPVMWTNDRYEANGYACWHGCGSKDRFNIIETDMEPWIDACMSDGTYVAGIGGVCYIDEGELEL